LFLVAIPGRRRRNAQAIGELEDFLIQNGVARNPDLLNVKGTRAPIWGIAGIVRSEMEGAFELSVPIEVTLKAGSNWCDVEAYTA